MLKLSIPSWIRNAAAALCGRRGAVTERAEQAGCSRQTVYDHGRHLVERWAERDQELAALRAEVAQLKAERDALQQRLQQAVVVGTPELERFAVVSQAMGVSLRQAEELLGTLLPAQRVPDHATLGRWTEAAGRRAGEVLAVLDPLCAPAVHTNQEARRVLTGPWRRAEAAWEEAEAADAQVAQTKRQGEDARGPAQQARRAWDKAERLLATVDRQEAAWQRARAALALFRPDGTWNERAWAEAEIEAALAERRGWEWKKVRNFLKDPRALTFLDRLHRRLAEAEPDAALRQACVRRWWLRHRAPPPPVPTTPVEQVQALLDAKVRDGKRTAAEQAAYDRVAAVLRTTVRASSAVEGINSVLRMQQGRHRKMTQALLDLKRLYGNCRRLQTGKRRGRCPYELLGAPLPSTDFWTLLQGVPQPPAKPPPEKVSSSGDGA
jgi:hypothetical protein